MPLLRTDATINTFAPSAPPQDPQALIRHLSDEVLRLSLVVQQLSHLSIQVAIREPTPKLTGMIRWAKAPWNPTGAGDGLVKWTGAAWVAV